MRIELPNDVNLIIEKIETSGHEAFVVGGAIRDSLLGIEPSDWDIVTSAKPEEIKQIFSSYKTFDISFGTVGLIVNKEKYEISTYKLNSGYNAKKASYAGCLLGDILHRDLTINSMAYNPKLGLIDYVNGLQDLYNKKIRFVGNPLERIGEDPLRTLRALRFELALQGFKLDDAVRDFCKEQFKKQYNSISIERIRAEINKVLFIKEFTDSSKLSDFFILMTDTVMPEFKPAIGFDQKSMYHQYDVFEHCIQTVIKTEPILGLRWAALLHDIGKPDTMTEDLIGYRHFYGHPEVSEQLADKILTRLKFSKRFKREVLDLVKHHDDCRKGINKTKLRSFISKHDERFINIWIKLKWADIYSHADIDRLVMYQTDLVNTVQIILTDGTGISLRELKVNGRDLCEELGINDGPIIGDLLNRLLHECHGLPKNNNREWLLAEAKRRYKYLKNLSNHTRRYKD